ncbi:MAG: MFS transporter [Rhodospirillales bacterium]|nr:MFS transporter [Rhodospirillales bacterium]
MQAQSRAAGTSGFRWFVVVLLFVTTVINYVDRSSISIAGPAIRADLHLSPVELGFIFSAFAWAYSPLQIPGSILVDRIAPRFLYTGVIFFWSLFSTLIGFATSFAGIFGLRLALGACEAPSFPMNNRIVTAWLPEAERARGVAIYVSGQYVGLAFLTPVLVLIQTQFGWQGMFIATGCVGLLWSGAFFALYRDPARAPGVSAGVRAGADAPIAAADAGAAAPIAAGPPVPAGRAFRDRRLWGLLLAHCSETAANWFFLTWFPTYLVRYRHIAFLKFGFLATLPFLAAYIGVLLSGTISDYLLRRGYSLTFARKLPIVSGLVLAVAIVGANFAQSPALIIACMTIAFFGSGLGAISWSLVSSVAPPNLVGLASGAFNFVGTSMGIIVPIVIGFLVRGGSFAPAILFIGAMSLLSVISYLFIMGPVEQVR